MEAEYLDTTTQKIIEYHGSGYISYFFIQLQVSGSAVRIEVDDELCFEFRSNGATMTLFKPVGVYVNSSNATGFFIYNNSKKLGTYSMASIEDNYRNIKFGDTLTYSSNTFSWYTDFNIVFKKKLKIITSNRRSYNFLINYVPSEL